MKTTEEHNLFKVHRDLHVNVHKHPLHTCGEAQDSASALEWKAGLKTFVFGTTTSCIMDTDVSLMLHLSATRCASLLVHVSDSHFLWWKVAECLKVKVKPAVNAHRNLILYGSLYFGWILVVTGVFSLNRWGWKRHPETLVQLLCLKQDQLQQVAHTWPGF